MIHTPREGAYTRLHHYGCSEDNNRAARRRVRRAEKRRAHRAALTREAY